MTDEIPAGRDPSAPQGDGRSEHLEQITQPAKLMRVGAMARQLLEEVRGAPLDDAARDRLGAVYSRSVEELADSLSPELQEELRSLSLPFDEQPSPTTAELRVAQAQLVGWLEGLFHGIQATVMAQQLAARGQLDEMRRPDAIAPGPGQRAGTYL